MAAESKEKEQLALELFKDSVKDILRPEHDDAYLLRWLTARKFDVLNAENMFRDSMEFRQKIGADTIVGKWQKPEVLQKYLPGGLCGYDREGAPLKIEIYGHLDMKGIMYSCKRQDLEKCKIRECEIIFKAIKEREKQVDKPIQGMTVIFDMEGVSAATHLWRPGVIMYLHLVSILENNYPEMLKRLLVINAPKIFPILYRMVRPLITDDMRRKIHVFGSNYKEKLLKYIDEENLPEIYGGKLTDVNGDAHCAAMIGLGGKVPESYYLRELCVTADMESAVVVQGDKLTLDFPITKGGSVLRWEFKTEEKDIGFGLDYKAPGSEVVKHLVPVQRVDSHIVPEDGSFECDEPGTYTVIFDNGFSWTKGKKVWYTIEVVAAEDRIKSELDEIAEGGDWAEIDKTAKRY